jgi:DNA-binding NtrC family response regulator
MPKILIFDQYICTRELFRKEFEDEGYDVLTVCSLRDALKYFRAETPAVVLFSIDSPGAELLGTIEQMLSADRCTPIVFTSSVIDGAERGCVELASPYMGKQSSLTSLKQAVGELAHHQRRTCSDVKKCDKQITVS